MSAQRCDLTELIIEQCACRTHRGGNATELDDTVGNRIVDPELPGRPFIAAYPGHCVCGTGFNTGDSIMYSAEGELIGTQCCTGDL